MLEIKQITKTYETDGFKQKALDNVSINFRDNEFASILGPSGSGKTTLLNIIGGLDRYTSGDLAAWLSSPDTNPTVPSKAGAAAQSRRAAALRRWQKSRLPT